jgi:hypothetical protein
MGTFLLSVIAAVGPLAIHCFVLLGRLLPAPINTGVRVFDRFYNRTPWLPSVLCGLCLALALAFGPIHRAPGLVFAAVAFALGAIDLIGCGASMYRYAQRRR